MFELSDTEYNTLKDRLRSQIASLEIDGRGKYPKYPPFAFTEMGVAMLSSVLRSETAIRVNRAIMRASVAMRNYITTTHCSITAELSEIRAKLALLERADARECRGGQRFCRRICGKKSWTIFTKLSQLCQYIRSGQETLSDIKSPRRNRNHYFVILSCSRSSNADQSNIPNTLALASQMRL